MDLSDNTIGVKFLQEEKIIYLEKILNYVHYTDPLYYYLFFGYGDGNVEMDEYFKKYPQLLEDKGFIRLADKDVKDTNLIFNLLFEYQTASLYINEFSDLDKRCDFKIIRDNWGRSLFCGYVILEVQDNYMVIKKDLEMPDWDLDKMGIPVDSVY